MNKMSCNYTNKEDSISDNHSGIIIKSLVLLFLLVLVVGGNCCVLRKVTNATRKWNSAHCMVRIFAIMGLLNGIINISVYFVSTVSGRWLFGGVLCQFYGVTSSVLASSWTWFLAIAAMERFMKLFADSEHTSLFSEVNTKIIAWGMVLLLLVLFLGPIYGWGEYSQFRGKIEILLNVFNVSSNTDAPTKSIHGNDNLQPITTHVFYHMLQTQSSINGSIIQLATHLNTIGPIVLRNPQLTQNGLHIPIRVANAETAICLWRMYESHHLEQELRVLFQNVLSEALGIDELELNVTISKKDLFIYTETFLNYQGGSTCSLDYTLVNPHIHSFIGFSWFCSLGLPYTIILYTYSRIFYTGLDNLCIYTLQREAITDVVATKVFAYSSIVSLMCSIPYYTLNLSASMGVYVSSSVHFTGHVLLYFSYSSVFIFYIMSRADGLCDDSSCSSCIVTFCNSCLQRQTTKSARQFQSPARQSLLTSSPLTSMGLVQNGSKKRYQSTDTGLESNETEL